VNGPRIIPSGVLRIAQHTPESAREEIRKMAAMGVKFTGEIALTPVPRPTEKEMDVIRAIVDEGKKTGVMIQVHAVSTPAMMAAVNAGVPLLVSRPIRHKAHQRLELGAVRRRELRDDRDQLMHPVEVLLLVMAADVVGLAGRAALAFRPKVRM